MYLKDPNNSFLIIKNVRAHLRARCALIWTSNEKSFLALFQGWDGWERSFRARAHLVRANEFFWCFRWFFIFGSSLYLQNSWTWLASKSMLKCSILGGGIIPPWAQHALFWFFCPDTPLYLCAGFNSFMTYRNLLKENTKRSKKPFLVSRLFGELRLN